MHAVGHLMERQLDPAASRVLERTLAVAEHHRPPHRRHHLGDPDQSHPGRWAGAQRRPAGGGLRGAAGAALARQAGLDVDRGIVVDERLRTSDRRISALGDCAQLGNEVGGLVAPAWEQARVIARQLSGVEPLAVYSPAAPVTRLKASGIDLAAMGSLQARTHDEDLSFTDPARGTYARLLIRDDRVAGAVLLGDNPSVGQVIQLFDRRAAVPLGQAVAAAGQGDRRRGTTSSVDSSRAHAGRGDRVPMQFGQQGRAGAVLARRGARHGGLGGRDQGDHRLRHAAVTRWRA